MNPKVLIYIQNLKKYLFTNNNTILYFSLGINDDLFFKYVGEFSEQNLELTGDPSLTQSQFEEIKKKLTPEKEKNYPKFYGSPIFGNISLN